MRTMPASLFAAVILLFVFTVPTYAQDGGTVCPPPGEVCAPYLRQDQFAYLPQVTANPPAEVRTAAAYSVYLPRLSRHTTCITVKTYAAVPGLFVRLQRVVDPDETWRRPILHNLDVFAF